MVVVGGGGVSYIGFAGLGVLCPHIPSDVSFQGINVNDASEVSPKSVLKVKVCAPESSEQQEIYYKKKTLWHKDLYFAKPQLD